MLCLTGLVGWGSIPLHVLCLGGLLTFIALWGMAYAVGLSTSNGKENRMNTDTAQVTEQPRLKLASAINTVWAIGTGAWSGAALSGKAFAFRHSDLARRVHFISSLRQCERLSVL